MIRLGYDKDISECDIICGDAGLDVTRALETAVLISLFTNRRAAPEDAVDGDQQGYWGDSFPLAEGEQWGSRLWTLARSKDIPALPLIAKDMCIEALAWLIDEGVVDEIPITVERIRPGVLGIEVTMVKPADTAPRFVGYWEVYYAV